MRLMKPHTAGILLLVLVLAMVGYVIQSTAVLEPFQEREGPRRCGVGLPPCLPVGEGQSIRCMNGWCRSDQIH